ncbi:response regulator transcription factor [Exilibacterium tricleocarpae]|uniref:Response regulator transcription factor n=1 Tax=Exilibacterium tricleocarpae TaxID=2591008 RepID=A0A545STH6_9GAMM|nr:response regulator transcription factor [Exilibacterium tricleocarpae]TQV68266.1 response regulator transcription factor [Exilibacterium tricleocarpae]
MRLLVVEDESHIREQLQSFLSELGYVVDAAADGREGLYCGEEYPYDLAVIDIGLPEINGIDLIRRLRELGKSQPILILTARGNWQDKVEGLEAGADDYLVKPFHNEELRARINALLRRSAGHATPQLRFGPICLDTAAKTVQINDDLLELTGFEYNTLEYLMHRAGEVISKTELTEHLYDQDFDRDSNVIEVFIGRLRKKLDPGGDLKPIATVRGQGYRFTLPASTDRTPEVT